MPKNIRIAFVFAGALGLIILSISLASPHARSATAAPSIFTVNNSSDLIDNNVGDGLCDAGSGNCTLRAAIMQANALTNTTIILPAGVYTLTLIGSGEDNAVSGDLDLTANLIISGTSAATTFIQGGPGWNDRLVHVLNNPQIKIRNLTLRYGNATGPGGGLYNNYGSVTLTQVSIISNTTSNSGGGIDNESNLVIAGGSIIKNYSGYSGGGLNNNGRAVLNQVTLISNTANISTSEGGAVMNQGAITLTNSTLDANRSRSGAAIYGATGSIVLINSHVGKNVSYGQYGAIRTDGSMFISGSLIISNSTLSTVGYGGGIVNASSGRLTIRGSTIASNTAKYSGGGIDNYGALTMTNSTLITNVTAGGGGGINNSSAPYTLILSGVNLINNQAGVGGGLYNGTNAPVIINSSSIAHNRSTGDGGGIYNFGYLQLIDNQIISNTGQTGGGGLFNYGRVFISHTNILSNFAGANGGGAIWTRGIITAFNSSFSYNTGNAGGAIYNGSGATLTLISALMVKNTANTGGGLFNSTARAVISNSQFTGNQSPNNDGGGIVNNNSIMNIYGSAIISNTGRYGGGISNEGSAVMTVTNSTIGQNAALRDGGGIYNSLSSASLYNVTLADNLADSDQNNSGHGGGLFQDSSVITLANTLIARNVDLNASAQKPDCAGSLNSLGYNLITTMTGCTLTGVLTGVISNTDVPLGPPQDNGGSTWTQALWPFSPAIDAGNPIGCKDAAGNLLTIDQRGVLRPIGPRCDIGAYEAPIYIHVYLPVVLK